MSAMREAIDSDIVIEKTRFASETDDPQVLTDIYNEQCNIAIWRRRLPTEFLQQVAQDISSNPMLNKTVQVRADSIENDIATIAADRIYGEQLRSYISEIIDMFCVLFDTNKVGLRLSVLDQAMCPRFHFDRVPCRLVTTFCGIGTQWLPNNKVNMSKLGHGSGGKSDEESGLISEKVDVQSLVCGDVALLKGDTWEGNEGSALVHRSPALKVGEYRLLMTIDFVA
jgi:hypothetical protein